MATRLGLFGAAGRMGLAVRSALAGDDAWQASLIDRPETGLPTLETFDLSSVDVLLDFSGPAGLAALLARLDGASVPLVSGATGLDADAFAALDRYAARAPVVWAANFSTGVTLLTELTRLAVRALGPEAEAEVVELHHHHKKDAPSGTALQLAQAIAEAQGLDERAFCHGREGQPGPRPKGEIGLHAIRGGDVVGEHTVYLFGPGERLELTHRLSSRDALAHGALKAAHWILTQPAGRYAMRDVLHLGG